MAEIAVGSIVEGVVTGITDFGAFVRLPNGKTGLVHISEIADTYVKDIRSHVNVNDKVKVKVLSLDKGGEKIGLSIRQAQPNGERRGGRNRRPRTSVSFEARLARFMRESEAKLAELKRSTSRKTGRK